MQVFLRGALGLLLCTFCLAGNASGRVLNVVVDGQLSAGDACPIDVEAVTFADIFIAVECSLSGDVIQFGPGEFSLANPLAPEADSRIDLESSLTIRGQGQDMTVLVPDATDPRPIRLLGGSAQSVRLENLTIAGGFSGPWISVDGASLNLTGITLRDGQAQDFPVLVAENGAELELARVQFLDLDFGVGSLVVANNTTLNGVDLSLSGNNVAELFFLQNSQAELTNLTITDNQADEIFFAANSELRLAFTTIAQNQTRGGPQPVVLGSNGPFVLNHVLIDAPDFRDCGSFSSILSQGHNISAPGSVDNTCSDFNQPTDAIDQPSGVRPPANTGGGVISVPLTADSIARNGASECVDTRGNPVPRDVRGFTRPGGQPCSIGSWQYFPTAAISQVVFAPEDPQRRYAATLGHGVFVSNDGGVNWASMSADLDGLAIADLAVSPANDQVLLAASTRNGVFRSADGGENWTASSTGLIGEALTVNRLQFDPADAEVVLAATNNGLYRSDDGGASWARVNGGLPEPEED